MYHIGNNLFQVQFAKQGRVTLVCSVTGRTENYQFFEMVSKPSKLVIATIEFNDDKVLSFSDMKGRLDLAKRTDSVAVNEVMEGFQRIRVLDESNYVAACNCINYAYGILDYDPNHPVKAEVERVNNLLETYNPSFNSKDDF